MKEIKIASEKGCSHCWGSGVIELSPMYYVVCFHCAGTGKILEEAELNAARKCIEKPNRNVN